MNMIDKLVSDIETKINNYFENLIGLHSNKGETEITIGFDTYYYFNKIIEILKKHTKINIHILKKNNNENKQCEKLLNKMNKIIKKKKNIKKKNFIKI